MGNENPAKLKIDLFLHDENSKFLKSEYKNIWLHYGPMHVCRIKFLENAEQMKRSWVVESHMFAETTLFVRGFC